MSGREARVGSVCWGIKAWVRRAPVAIILRTPPTVPATSSGSGPRRGTSGSGCSAPGGAARLHARRSLSRPSAVDAVLAAAAVHGCSRSESSQPRPDRCRCRRSDGPCLCRPLGLARCLCPDTTRCRRRRRRPASPLRRLPLGFLVVAGPAHSARKRRRASPPLTASVPSSVVSKMFLSPGPRLERVVALRALDAWLIDLGPGHAVRFARAGVDACRPRRRRRGRSRALRCCPACCVVAVAAGQDVRNRRARRRRRPAHDLVGARRRRRARPVRDPAVDRCRARSRRRSGAAPSPPPTMSVLSPPVAELFAGAAVEVVVAPGAVEAVRRRLRR